jgi:hypothetical protein
MFFKDIPHKKSQKVHGFVAKNLPKTGKNGAKETPTVTFILFF